MSPNLFPWTIILSLESSSFLNLHLRSSPGCFLLIDDAWSLYCLHLLLLLHDSFFLSFCNLRGMVLLECFVMSLLIRDYERCFFIIETLIMNPFWILFDPIRLAG